MAASGRAHSELALVWWWLAIASLRLAIAQEVTVRYEQVTFWQEPYYEGNYLNLWMQRNRCYQLGEASDTFSSMRTYGTCVDLYTRDDCFGGMFRMESNETRCHRNLGECDMNDRVSSVRLCPRCRNSCYFGLGDDMGELEENGDEEVCQCHCNCGGGSCGAGAGL